MVNKIIKAIGLILLIIFIIALVWGISLGIASTNICKRECSIKGTGFYEVISNGKMNINDLCVCYYPANKFESFIIK